MINFNIITIFPEIFSSYFKESIIGRAAGNGKIKINIVNLRNFALDKHKTVDDTPYGGGAGMVMKVDVLYRALNHQKCLKYALDSQVFLLSAKGEKWNQEKAKKYSELKNITLICGRYEGVDERIVDYIDGEVSIGDYVLTGGEIGAMAIIDSITRLLPGVLGNESSSVDESHSVAGELEYPQYTRPEIFIDDNGKESSVPEVLLSGNHAEIEKWRKGKKKRFSFKNII